MRKRILYVQYTNPAVYPSLQHSAHLLAEQGWDVLFLGIRAIGTEAVIPEAHPRITFKLWGFGPPGWRLKLHYTLFALWALLWTWRWRPRWLYVSDPEACPIATFIRTFARVSIAYHEHDSPSLRPARRWMSFVYDCRRRFAKEAEICILPNEPRLDLFKREIGRERGVFSVWNCPSLMEVGPPRAAHDDHRMAILYQGSLVPSRFPATLLDVLAQLPETITLTAVGYETVGHPGYASQLRQRAADLQLGARVRVSEGLRRSELVDLGRRCDVGIAFQPMQKNDVNMQFMVGASNKFYEYLGNGLALLISNSPEWVEAFVTPGYALACDPEKCSSLVEALRWFFDHPAERTAMGERGREKVVTAWNYETQFQPVLDVLERHTP